MSAAAVRYSQFHPDSLLQLLLERYSLPEDAAVLFFRGGLNDIYKVTSSQGAYYLRISLHDVHSTEEIEEEIRFILRLRACDLPVVEPILCRDGAYVWEIDAPEGMRQAVLFREVVQNPSGDGITLMKNLGITAAQIHTAVRLQDLPTVRPKINAFMLVEEPIRLLTPYLLQRPDDFDFLNRTAEKLWLEADSVLSAQEDTVGYCHGDIQPGNYYFQGEQPVLFDFDCMGVGYFAYDLGVLLANLTFMDNEIYEKPIWQAVIEGYCQVRPISYGEKRAIYLFAALQMLRVLAYHAKIRDQNQGAFYYMTDPHLDTFFGAYKRLTTLACRQAELSLF